MKKIIKRDVIIVLLALFIIIGFFMSFIIRANNEKKKMTPTQTMAINDSVFTLQDDFVNMYCFKSHNKYIVFDAGNNRKNIENELAKLNIDPLQVIAVFLTHTDQDHIASIPLYKSAAIYLSANEEQMINGKTARLMGMHNKANFNNYTLINDMQNIELQGLNIQGVLVPGHTPGSMCYLVNNMYLITGDALSLNNGKAEAFVDIFNMDTKTQLESLKKLALYDSVQYILTAHHGYSTNYNKAFESYK